MALSESSLDVELPLDLGIGPRLGTNPRSESYRYKKKNYKIKKYCLSHGLRKTVSIIQQRQVIYYIDRVGRVI